MKDSKRIKKAWVMYDWANSVYSLVITSTIFPIYYTSVTSKGNSDIVSLFGIDFINTSLYAYALAFSFLMVAILSPLLSGIADYSGRKVLFLKAFCYLGSIGCTLMFFFNENTLALGIFAFVIANIGFWGSQVFYNSFLPEIAPKEEHDQLSAKGFAMGYIGSVILLIFSLTLVLKPEFYGISDKSLPARICFLLVGLWWSGFAQITFARLPKALEKRKITGKIIWNGYRELRRVWLEIKEQEQLKRFLYGFFFWALSVQTVMQIATLFGTKVLSLKSSELIITILIIQLVAIGGAFFFSNLSKRMGNKFSLATSIFIWIFICIAAYFVQTSNQFYALAMAVGFVMGGIQAMSRSTYAKLMPDTKDTASYFSFYDVTEKVSIVIGTFSYGLIEQITGSMRNSILMFVLFFTIGLLFLLRVKMNFNKVSHGN